MKKTIALLLIIPIFYAQKSYSQTENFLKLNRIVTIDSNKNSINIGMSKTILFRVTVPNNVYWKSNYIGFDNNGSTYGFIKINNSYICSFINSVNVEKNTPIWIKPNSIITFESSSSSNTTINPSMYFSAEEFIIAP